MVELRHRGRGRLAEIMSRRRMETRRDVSRWVCELRMDLGLTQGRLAEMAGVSRRTIARIEARRALPSVPVLRKLDGLDTAA